jgi:hypothetical protein
MLLENSDFAVQILTIIFYPADRKIADDSEEVTLGFSNKNSSTMSELSKGPDSKADPIQMPPLSFSKVSMSISPQHGAFAGCG